MKNQAKISIIVVFLLLAGLVVSNFYVYAPDIGKPGGPISGLSLVQLKRFYEARDVFKKTFTPNEGLGPLYNAESCYSCHGSPGIVGNQGTDPSENSLTYIASSITESPTKPEAMKYQDSDFFLHEGGPIVIKKTITDTFGKAYPEGCKMTKGTVPKESTFVSSRLAPAIWGLGLIDAIPEEQLEDLELNQDDNLITAGLSVSHKDSITHQDKLGRFGCKNQYTSLLDAVVKQMNVSLGLTTKYEKTVRTATVNYNVPDCLRPYLPAEPNDNGTILSKLTYFLALAAPPEPGTISEASNRGRATFEKLGCAQCHVPTLTTASEYYVVDPESNFPTKRFLRIQALENREVSAYSDFLLHNMGPALADGIATSGGVSGAHWRTTPLWGLRFRKYYLHDGRTTNVSEAILAHGGQAQLIKEKFASLNKKDKGDLLIFLNSL